MADLRLVRTVKHPTVDVTEWVLLATAPLTASGCNEIVLSSTLKKHVETAAKAIAGPGWRRQYTVVRRDRMKMFYLKCNGCPAEFRMDSIGLAEASHHDDISGKAGPAKDCAKYYDYECGGWSLDVKP
jgi:hypothetical protein